jgi:hypothetical protein
MIDYGFDDVQLGYTGSGVSVDNTTVAWFRDSSFAVGMFGLNYRETNFTLATPDLVPSFLSKAYTAKQIPALSCSYTADAYYNQNDRG